MAKKLIFLFLNFFIFFGFSQKKNTAANNSPNTKNGYNIAINTENLKDKTLELSVYNGNLKTFSKIGSAKITENKQTVYFTQTQPVLFFPARISFAGEKEKHIDFFVYNGLETNCLLVSEDVSSIKTNNFLNNDFLTYQKENQTDKKTEIAKQIISKYASSEDLKLFFNLEIRKNLKPKENEANFAKKMLEGIDLGKKNIVLMPNIYAFINNYFNNFKNYNDAISSFLGSKTCDSANFSFYTNWILKNIQLREKTGEKVKDNYDFLLSKYFQDKKCQEKQQELYNTLKEGFSNADIVINGNPLPDFEMYDGNEKNYSFSKYISNGNVTILVFYDPGCIHCEKELPKISSDLQSLEQETSKKINKICLLFLGNLSNSKEFIEKTNIGNWLNVYSKDSKFFMEKLGVHTTPTVFILDKDGKLASRYYSLEILKKLINK